MEQPGSNRGVLTLTTDFGTRDHYVGTMKGVIATVAPEVTVVDITNDVPHFDIAAGAFAIAQAYRYFPEGTVHVVVVDPGVGSSRRALAARVGGHYFVAPDNGVLSFVLDDFAEFEARIIDPRHGLAVLSRTFHGRDLFAPTGARLAAGLPFREIGPELSALQSLVVARSDGKTGRVLHVDVFGNIVTSFRSEELPRPAGLSVSDLPICHRADSYDEMIPEQLTLIEGSSGLIEISVKRGSAAERLGVSGGEMVTLVEAPSVERSPHA